MADLSFENEVLRELARRKLHEALLFELASDGRDFLSARTVALSEGIDDPTPEEAAEALSDVLYSDVSSRRLREEYREAIDWRTLNAHHGDPASELIEQVAAEEKAEESKGSGAHTITGDEPMPDLDDGRGP